ncbi:hypothetical protein Tco_1124663 [Tanacetum coccineum]|uniref:Uncharacterized protein n=1 Tax=Tanacetum coccineum TaxID=301880 RepID=A0ABQ5J9M8_9ASTR
MKRDNPFVAMGTEVQERKEKKVISRGGNSSRYRKKMLGKGKDRERTQKAFLIKQTSRGRKRDQMKLYEVELKTLLGEFKKDEDIAIDVYIPTCYQITSDC